MVVMSIRPSSRRLDLVIIISTAFLFIIMITSSETKSTIEPCSSADSCPSLLYYTLPYDSKLSEIAFRFGRSLSDLLATNSIPMINDTTYSTLNQIIVHAGESLRVPISCSCVDGIRRSTSTGYTVRAADTLQSISERFGGLVSEEQIGMANGNVSDLMMSSGQRLAIPLPCTCFGNTNNGVDAVYMSYVVQEGQTLENAGRKFHVPPMELAAINGLAQPVVHPGDIISIPISACSSSSLKWYHESLIVANGSSALTASDCIRCACGPQALNLRCFPSGVVPSCTNLQCQDSDLFIGELIVNKTTLGCNITGCVYRGHNGGKIFRSLASSFYAPCPDDEGSRVALPNSTAACLSPSPSPSPAPSSASYRGTRTTKSIPRNRRHDYNAASSGQRHRVLRRGTLIYTTTLVVQLPPFFALLLLL